MVRVVSVQPLSGYVVRLAFTDGSVREVDLERFLNGPIFRPLRQDRRFFEQVRVDPELGTIVWPNGADVDPDVLAGSAVPAWATRPEVM